ncbi:hypothetical protein ACFFIX_21135 [Metabacillus herbersteinensis]|uniref:Uncharacterized protein n=1 Tax=Metabacillus herbersteinensis TaxID=283816 RepID=A0ABV6GJL6_9BACI
MTILLNKSAMPKLYKSISANLSVTSNQEKFRVNYLQEFVNQQQKINEKLSDEADVVSTLVRESSIDQKNHFHEIFSQLEKQEIITNPLIQNMEEQQASTTIILERLSSMDRMKEELLKKIDDEGLLNTTIIDQLSFQDQSIQGLARKFDEYEQRHIETGSQLTSQAELNKQILEKLELQEAFHQTIVDRLNQQEALTQKISRELDNLKAILFERVTHIVDKIDNNYKLTTSYIANILTRTGLIQRFSVPNEKKEKETISK